jgi:hypothetical protein
VNCTTTYPVKIWSTTVVVAPFLMLSLSTQPDLVSYFFSSGFLQFYILAVVIGAFVSIPALLFLMLCYNWLVRLSISAVMIRLILTLICVITCITIFILFSLPDLSKFWTRGNILLMASYVIPLIAGVMFYKLGNVEKSIL